MLVLANVTIKGANFWGLERRKNVVPIRSTFKVGTVEGEQPGSIWQWQEVLDLIPKFSKLFCHPSVQIGSTDP